MQERSTDQKDKEAVEHHLKVLEAWGNKPVWQGVPDTLASVVTGATKRGNANDKCSKDMRHLSV